MSQLHIECEPTYITTATTTHVTTVGVNTLLHTVVLLKSNTGGTITFQSLASSPVVYFQIPASQAAGTYTFDCKLNNGLDVVTAGGDKLVVNTVVL